MRPLSCKFSSLCLPVPWISIVCNVCSIKQCCTQATQWKIHESFSVEMKTTREVSPWVWSKRLLQSTTGWHLRTTFTEKVKQNPELLGLYHYCESELRVSVPRLLFTSSTLFFSSLDSHGAASVHCLFQSVLCITWLQWWEKKKKSDLRLSLRTLISQSSWLHKSFLMYDTGNNRELHVLFTVQHQGSSGVGSPPAPLLLTCVVLTRKAGRRAMIKHWLRNKGRQVQVSRPDARIQPPDATRFQEPLWTQLRLLRPAALGSPLLVPFSGWLGWGLH